MVGAEERTGLQAERDTRVEYNTGRVSTPITSFDLVRRTGKISNAREYKLLGPPDFNKEAVHVWEHHSQIALLYPLIGADVDIPFERVAISEIMYDALVTTEMEKDNGDIQTAAGGKRKN
ncbi:hypothetical protein [Cupriavidus basilensis]|uniref:hypothetical protein n=1 Tax=Cupriavidus basilensis TaxID=68895 RepID=UPI00178C64CE|nr:hypothetical protein [Cupriavidus basilensis]